MPPRTGRTTTGVLIAALLAVPIVGMLLVHALLPDPPGMVAPRPVSSGTHLPAVEVAEGGTPEIRGHVLDASGDPVEGAIVRLVSPGPPYAVLLETRSERAGEFSFERVRLNVRVVAAHDPDGVASSAEVQPAEGRTVEVTLVLSAAGVVQGTVVDAEDHPVSGAAVSTEGAPWIVRRATSDDVGAFRITAISDQATSLVAVARGYKAAHVTLVRAEGQTELTLRVVLVAAPPLDGEVIDADGNPVSARIVACEGQSSEQRTTSQADGTFQLPPAAIGCDAVAEHDQFAASDAVSLVEGRHVALRLRPGGSIEGMVVDERGAGLPSFTVGIESFSAPRRRSSRSGEPRTFDDLRGSFRWDKLAPGTYVLSASVAGRGPARSGPVEVSAGSVAKGVRIVLAQGGVLLGHVYDDRHAPIAGAEMSFDAVSSVLESGARSTSDGAGAYRLEGAPPGRLTLRVEKEGYRLRLVSGLHVEPGRTLAADVILTATDGGPSLELGGIGAALRQGPEGVSLRFVFPGDPAERAGLRTGDRILQVDGEDTGGLSVADVLQRLRGEPGTPVAVSVERPDTHETIDVMVVRGAIVR